MKTTKHLVLVSLLLLISAIVLFGCAKEEVPVTTQPVETPTATTVPQDDVETVDFKYLEVETLDAAIQNEIDLLKQSEGYFLWDDPLNGQIVFIGMGLKATGGFSIEVEQVERIGSEIHIKVIETSPGPDDMVTQALTNPFVLIQVGAQNKGDAIVVSNQEGKVFVEIELNSQSHLVMDGTYVGQIDNNSIEVAVGESFMVFRNFLMGEIIQGFETGDGVKITYTEIEEGQFQLVKMEHLK
jgi:hypothetical protein